MTAPTEFFEPGLVTLVAGGLPALPHPSGTPLVFPAHADTFPGDTEEEQAAKANMNRLIAEALLNHFKLNEHTLVPNAQLAQPQRFGDHTIVTLHCASCAGVLITVTMSQGGKISIPPRAINPDCGARHGVV
ncbi:hypothetical protein [Mycolicibacterium palauense]|uniref:hypothetical protein n=1 Tax=Mycolicibacterium palauense TaxID=2034511 RepID=UPI000BFEE0F5|nr:hypothetical protein [Mycolicibacterium palauense]